MRKRSNAHRREERRPARERGRAGFPVACGGSGRVRR
ncbi:hypothetical protein A2U01_0080043, partial [Trifolium medium]|nr:hypothetical protein [Trifolium medium]